MTYIFTSIRELLQYLRSKIVEPYQIADGDVVFTLQYSLLGVAIYSMVVWNFMLAEVAVLGFIVIAQLCINRYFAHPFNDAHHRAIVALSAVGYSLLLVVSSRLWDDKLSYGISAGFVLFLTRICESYFAKPIVVTGPPAGPPEPKKE